MRHFSILLMVIVLLYPIASNPQSTYVSRLKGLVEIADKLGVIELVKNKLINQPDPAFDNLVVVLEEISKIYSSLDTELSAYLAIRFDPAMSPRERQDAERRLIELEGGAVRARMAAARGHCSKIGNIYSRHLRGWFSMVLSPAENQLMRELFQSLEEYDGIVIGAIDSVAGWLADQAHVTLSHVRQDNWKEANRVIRQARWDILPDRRRIAEAMMRLRQLQAEFIEVSAAIGRP